MGNEIWYNEQKPRPHHFRCCGLRWPHTRVQKTQANMLQYQILPAAGTCKMLQGSDVTFQQNDTVLNGFFFGVVSGPVHVAPPGCNISPGPGNNENGPM